MKNRKLIKPILSIVLALLIGAVIIAAAGQDPVNVYKVMFKGAFGSKNAVTSTLVKTITMIFVGLSYGFAYKCGLVNIGIEGQLYMGGLCSALVGIYLPMPAMIHIPLCLAAGFMGGALIGGIVAWLKVQFKASEMITTVMMNYIVIDFVGWMVNGPIKEEKGTYPQSESILETAMLPTIIPKTQLTAGIFIALAAIVIYAVYWRYTAKGFEMEIVGANEKAAEYAGIRVKKTIMSALLLSGGLGGLAGSMEVLGVQHKIMDGLSAGYGFDGIAVSLLGNNSGLGIFLSSLLFGALRCGGNAIQMFTSLSIAVIYILQSIVILLVVVDVYKKRGMKTR